MNAILYEEHGLFNGSLVDCLDLLVWSIKHGIDIEFRIISEDDSSFNKIKSYIYHLYEMRYKNYIYDVLLYNKVFKKTKIAAVKGLSKAVIFDYTTVLSLKDFLLACDTIYVSNLLSTDLEKNNIKDISELNCKKIFNESFYNFIGTEEYRQKFLLEPLKTNYLPEKDRYSLIICPGVFKDKLEENINSGMYKYAKYSLSSFYYFYRYSSSINKSLYNKVSEVLYFQSPVVYDRKPRILMEASYLGIPVKYYQLDNSYKPDGSTFRYYANNNHDYDYKDREYSTTDKLIEWLSNE